MKTISIILIGIVSTALAGPEPYKAVVHQAAPSVAVSPYNDNEFNISLLGAGSWTRSHADADRYLGVDHTFGGTLAANYFFAKYFGAGLSFSGYDVANVATAARVATSSDSRRFVGNLLVNATFRYPIGTSAFAPYVRTGAGSIFNGGNATLQQPDVSIGKTIQFEAVEHDAVMVAEGAIGVEYRLNHTFGIVTEAAFDKVTRPKSNFGTVRAGINVAF